VTTELVDAIKAKDDERARALVLADPTVALGRDADGLLPATHALYYGLDDLAKELLPPDPSLTVFEASSFGRAKRVEELLNEDPGLVSVWSSDGFSVLHLALFSGDQPTVRAVLRHDPDLETPAKGEVAPGVRPIHTAVFVHDRQLAELLIDAGADVNSRERGGLTPLHAAAENKDTSMAQMLVARGGDPTMRDEQGRTAADIAAGAGADALATWLREQATDESGGRTPNSQRMPQ
jgi:uncharacterized protein